MNIFILDKNINRNVRYYVDNHIVKMPLETAHLLCTTLHLFNIETPYKQTHTNHPCAKWVRESLANYKYLCKLGKAICKEYSFRYGKVHACEKVIDYCSSMTKQLSKHVKDQGKTKAAQAMPTQYKRQDNVVEAYRTYYREGKKHLFSWKNREKPFWI